MNATQWLAMILMGGLCLAGCATGKPGSAAGGQAGEPSSKLIVTPAGGPAGRVATVNGPGQFVVITLDPGEMPAQGQKLNLYRAGLKVGEVKVWREERGLNVVADIVAGEARAGDEVRAD